MGSDELKFEDVKPEDANSNGEAPVPKVQYDEEVVDLAKDSMYPAFSSRY